MLASGAAPAGRLLPQARERKTGMTNPMQPLDPQSPPGPVTPVDTPSDPAGYAMVTPHGQGPAPYDIQAPMDDLTAVTEAAGRLAGAGVVYPQGPRQAQTEALLDSPPGFATGDGYSITAGWSGGGGDTGWPNDPEPPQDPYNQWTPGNASGSPTGTYQGTT